MRSISLGHTGLSTTAIGYGCAGLMRPATDADRRALLTAAFEAGIRHYDVARYYGHGQAEGILGKFLAETKCRDQITITTKFGMEPPAIGGSSRGRSLMSLARRIAAIHPVVRKTFSTAASLSVRKSQFEVARARASLETSLRELRTDRIDLFLLHEATLEDTRTEGLLEFLEAAKRAGHIREFGLGSDFPVVSAIVTNNPACTRVVQIANGLGQWNRRLLPRDPARLVNTHGALKILPTLEAALSCAPSDVAHTWQAFGSPRGAALAGLVLGLALHDNSHGITLFSSTQPGRIHSNVGEAVRHGSCNAGEWAAFEQMAEAALAAPSGRSA